MFSRTQTTHIVVYSTVYATFVILSGPVHSTVGYNSFYFRRVDGSRQDDKSSVHRRVHHNMGCLQAAWYAMKTKVSFEYFLSLLARGSASCIQSIGLCPINMLMRAEPYRLTHEAEPRASRSPTTAQKRSFSKIHMRLSGPPHPALKAPVRP